MAILRVKPALQKPVVGGSINEWGDILNSNMDAQDSFNNSVLIDSEAKDSEIERLDREKVSKTDVDTVVKTSVDEYINTNGKMKLDEHIEKVNKPELDKYTEEKKKDISSVINDLGNYNINSETNYKTWIGSESDYQSLLVKENGVLYMTFDSLFNVTTKYFKPKLDIIKDGLVCWLDARDGINGNPLWKDRSGNGNNSTLHNFNWTKESGFTGKSLKFDGINDYAEITSTSILSSKNELTVVVNMVVENNPTQSPYQTAFVLTRTTGGYLPDARQFSLSALFNNQGLIFDTVGTVERIYLTSQQSLINQQNDFVLSKSANSGMKLYNNSVLLREENSYTRGLLESKYCFIGKEGLDKFLKGTIHSIKIYNRALKEEEIQQNYEYEQSIDRIVLETLDEKIYDKDYCIGNTSDLTEEQKKTFRLSNDKTKFVSGVNNVSGITAETYTYEEIQKIMETPEWRSEEEDMLEINMVKNINGEWR